MACAKGIPVKFLGKGNVHREISLAASTLRMLYRELRRRGIENPSKNGRLTTRAKAEFFLILRESERYAEHKGKKFSEDVLRTYLHVCKRTQK